MTTTQKVTGVKFVVGFPESGSSEIQSVIFDKENWDEAAAKEWLGEHDLKAGTPDVTANTLRFRQKNPARFSRFRIVDPSDKRKVSYRADPTTEVVIDADIIKADDQRQLAFGWASVSSRNGKEVKDRQKDYIPDEDLEKMAYRFVVNQGKGGEMHQKVGVGFLIESMAFTEDKQKALGIDLKKVGWWIGFKVTDKDTWKSIKDGKYKALSIRGRARRTETESD